MVLVVAVAVICVCAATGLSTALTMMDAMRLWRRESVNTKKKKHNKNKAKTTAHHGLYPRSLSSSSS
jgi:hypothetical protein